MIVVLGRPGLSTTWRSGGALGQETGTGLAGRAARIALLARGEGADVELVGAVGDDPEGDEVMVRLGRAGVGHAAVLRDPAARTPVGEAGRSAPLPRLDPADIALGLSYVAECRVLVIAESLPAEAQAVAAEAAAYHGAAVIAIVTTAAGVADGLPDDATLLEAPMGEPRDADEAAPGEGAANDKADADADDEAGADADVTARSDAFNRLVARYAAALDRGEDPATAFHAASHASGWESVPA